MHYYFHGKITARGVLTSFERFIIVSITLLVSAYVSFAADKKAGPPAVGEPIDFTVVVYDAGIHSPLEGVRIILRRAGLVVGEKVSNPQGVALFRDIDTGRVRLTAHLVGYIDYSETIMIAESNPSDTVTLKQVSQEEVVVTGERELNVSTIDLGTGNQVFESETYHAPPTARMTNIIQENLAGAVKAPSGEVHIRGYHGEFSYYVDGIPIPLGVFGGLNEVVDPKVIERANFMTGGFSAEYGGQAALIDIQNRVPAGSFHLDASTYAGSYLVFNGTKAFSPGNEVALGQSSPEPGDTLGGRVGPFRALNSNGQTLSLSNHIDNFAYFISGSRQETDRRIDNPVVNLYNDHGLDYFLYGKFDYLLGARDYLTANLNYGNTNTEVPFDIDEQGFSPDRQTTSNSFQTLSYYHTISSENDHESNFFVGGLARQGTLLYTPSPVSPVSFQFAGDSTLYALTEDRSFSSLGLITKYDVRLSHYVMFKVGLNFTSTTGTEDFTSRNSAGSPGPNVSVHYAGSNFGLFGQTEYHPFDWTRIEAGIRYDQQIAPDAALQTQVSPRIRWNLFFDGANSAYLYYGRMFIPNNVEGIRLLSSATGTNGVPTIPTKENFYEMTYMHSFDFGMRSKFAFYYKDQNPGVDDETIGSSAVKTPVNIEEVKITGLELGLSYSNPATPFSGYLNVALNHAYGSGAITGGFLPADDDGIATDLDHDQRLSIVGSVNYQPQDWFVNLTAIYGSGLTNGNPNGSYVDAVTGASAFGTGLFDFNSDAHVPPYIFFNLALGRTFALGGESTLEPSIYITNLFDSEYLLKGAYFSGASYGERRNVVFKMALHI